MQRLENNPSNTILSMRSYPENKTGLPSTLESCHEGEPFQFKPHRSRYTKINNSSIYLRRGNVANRDATLFYKHKFKIHFYSILNVSFGKRRVFQFRLVIDIHADSPIYSKLPKFK